MALDEIMGELAQYIRLQEEAAAMVESLKDQLKQHMAAAVWQILTVTSSSVDGLRRFINGRRAVQISPAYSSAAAYAAGEWETVATLPELLQLIRQEVTA